MKFNGTILGVFSGALLAVGCWMPWVVIVSQQLTLTGMETTGTSYGKPGLLHLILLAFFLVFTIIPKTWAKRFNLLVVALNASWLIRNWLLIGICRGGECPERQLGFYLVALACILMLMTALFPRVKA